MNTITIILLTLASFVIGAALAWLLKKKPADHIVTSTDSAIETDEREMRRKIAHLQTEKDSLDRELTELQNQNDILNSKLTAACKEHTEQNVRTKQKYEQLLTEAKARCVQLDEELTNAMKGNIDDSVQEKLAEIGKLKKKINELEEDLEDSEDDNNELRKKISSRNEELEELQDNLNKEQKVSRQLYDDLNNARQEMEEMDYELNRKTNSISFIQEILSATEVEQSDSRVLNKEIDNLEAFVKGPLTDIYSLIFTNHKDIIQNNLKKTESFDQIKQKLYDNFDQWSSTKRKRWLDGKRTIAFVGEFSAGKTSIVNRILSQDNPAIPRLPVSTKATTAIPTYIAGAKNVHYTFISGDGKMKTINENTFRRVSKETLDQVKGISSLIKYFVMTYQNPNLKGLSLLDTPGFNSNDKEDRERTIDVINECDALFWVFDVNTGTVNRSSISIIKEKLNKPLYVVINKVDTKPESEVNKVEELIRKTLSNEGLKIQQFIRFSSQAPLDNIMVPIQNVEKIDSRSNFLTFMEQDINKYLNMFNKEVEYCNKIYNESVLIGSQLSDEFKDSLNTMKAQCEEAYHIPKWVEHFFSSDRFEMTDHEGNQLKEILESIANEQITELSNISDLCIETAQEVQQQYNTLCTVKSTWKQLDECYKQFKKIQTKIQNNDR